MFSNLTKAAAAFVSENASAILTAGGVVGTVATAALSVRAGMKSQQILQAEEQANKDDIELGTHAPGTVLAPLTTFEKAKLVAPQFIPPVLTGAATVAAIVFANRINAQRAAALVAAYTASAKQRDEYRAKLEEKLGVKKAETAEGEIQQERIDRNPPNQLIVVGTGDVLFYDAFSDRYFKSTVEAVRKAERVVNGEIDTGSECSLRTFYRELDQFPDTHYDDMLGWNIQHPCRISITAEMMNNEACLCLEFVNLPMPNYKVDY